ncbi:MAG TPA: CHAD domain-containing protein [Hyphomicrobiaceae bacterium]|nr:CHAD domain-containing protein [Hyphomicrobiaceae bacterium]
MTSMTGREFELKLELTPEELKRVNEHPALRGLTVGEPTIKTLHSIYFDTPDQRLRRAGASLRVRFDGEQWWQTLKVEGGVMRGVSHPVEAEAALPGPELDLNAIPDARLRREIKRLVRGLLLEPVFETVVTRTARRLHTERGELELALDEGVVRAGSSESALCEAELELKSGAADGLLQVAAKLFSDQPVRLTQVNKGERGYNLVLGRAERGPRPVRAETVELARDVACGKALALFVESAARQIITNRRVVLETDDPEGAHQLRVGLRRLRSALTAFRPIHDTASSREMKGHARILASAVGQLRDADILIDAVYAPAAAVMRGHAGLAPLKAALLAERAQRRELARAALLDGRWSALQLYLALWPAAIEDGDELNRPVCKFSGEALQRLWKKVVKLGRSIDDLDSEGRHEMRKSLKELRYTVEFFESLYDPADVRPFLKKLKGLQDIFGYINDVETARAIEQVSEARCPESREAQRAAGYMIGWHTARAVDAWDRAKRGWKVLKKTGPFWR